MEPTATTAQEPKGISLSHRDFYFSSRTTQEELNRGLGVGFRGVWVPASEAAKKAMEILAPGDKFLHDGELGDFLRACKRDGIG